MYIEKLFSYIERYANESLSIEDKNVLSSSFQLKKIIKRHAILEEGSVSRSMNFVVIGSFKMISIDRMGNERIVSLFLENWWANDRESFWLEVPSKYFITAWEDSEILSLEKQNENFERVNRIPAFMIMRNKIDDLNSIASQNRIHGLISKDSEERYEELLALYPEFFQRFPQHILASYLGITKETLSRIRNTSLKKHT